MNAIKYSKKESKEQRPYLEMMATTIIDYVKKYNIHILRYDSKSSESIYLKFDYGLAGTLRISAHPGKKHLGYTFNLIKGLSNPYKETQKNSRNNSIIYRYYYPENLVNNLAIDIVRYKKYKENKYGEQRYNRLKFSRKNYTESKLNQPEKEKNKRSFWSMCTEV